MSDFAELTVSLQEAREEYVMAVGAMHGISKVKPDVSGFPDRSPEMHYAIRVEWEALISWQQAHRRHQAAYKEEFLGIKSDPRPPIAARIPPYRHGKTPVED